MVNDTQIGGVQYMEIVQEFIQSQFKDQKKHIPKNSQIFSQNSALLKYPYESEKACQSENRGNKNEQNMFSFKGQDHEWVLQISNQKLEVEYFKVTLLAIIMNQPRFFLEKLCLLDPANIYQKAKNEGIDFCQFHEWLSDHIQKFTYNPKNEFVEMQSFILSEQQTPKVTPKFTEKSFIFF